MTRVLDRKTARKASRDDEYRARHKRHHLERIKRAETPADHAREAGDYLVDVLRFVVDDDHAWSIAEQIGKVIVRAADGLSEHVRRGGRQ